jgi:hypothetical protein
MNVEKFGEKSRLFWVFDNCTKLSKDIENKDKSSTSLPNFRLKNGFES